MSSWMVVQCAVIALGLWLNLAWITWTLMEHGRWDAALFVARFVPGAVTRAHLRLSALGYSGRMTAALELVEQPRLRFALHPFLVNAVVNTLVTAGRYQAALDLGRLARTGAATALLQVNLAEAEYNLGRWDAALARLEAIPAARQALVVAGIKMQLAWVLAHLGRPDRARAAWKEADVDALGRLFRAEAEFTGAAVALADGRCDEALSAAERGIACAMRVSSKRNGLFLRARVLVALGRNAEALVDFERAANDAHRMQGGGALLAWGDLLLKLERRDDARRAWQLAVERDPESESAVLAKARLAGATGTGRAPP